MLIDVHTASNLHFSNLYHIIALSNVGHMASFRRCHNATHKWTQISADEV